LERTENFLHFGGCLKSVEKIFEICRRPRAIKKKKIFYTVIANKFSPEIAEKYQKKKKKKKD
jgi:hypothetical protein